jgi:hypothetical protein
MQKLFQVSHLLLCMAYIVAMSRFLEMITIFNKQMGVLHIVTLKMVVHDVFPVSISLKIISLLRLRIISYRMLLSYSLYHVFLRVALLSAFLPSHFFIFVHFTLFFSFEVLSILRCLCSIDCCTANVNV